MWFMRQAGRSLPEYRELRAGGEMLDACLDPALAAEITMQPVRRRGVDAAVFFSDIVVPVLLAGVAVRIVAGHGPQFDEPVRSAQDVARLPRLEPDALAPITEAVAITVAKLGTTPLIGFGGAPYTLASYLVEGGPSKDAFAHPHDDARRPGGLGSAARLVRRCDGCVPAGAGRGGGECRATVRLLGGVTLAFRLRTLGSAALPPRA